MTVMQIWLNHDIADSSSGKESTCNAGDPGLILGAGRSTREGIGYPLQYSWASWVAQLVKNPPAMWKTWVQSLGWKDPWRKEQLPIPVFWPGEFHELYSPWGHKELDMTEQLSLSPSLMALPRYAHRLDFPGGSVVKNLPTNAGDRRVVGSIPG